MMKKIIAQDQNEWVLRASNWLFEKGRQYEARSLYLPAGETPKPLYKYWQQQRPDFLNKIKMIQIDDVLTGNKKDIFRNFFFEELPAYADKIEYFDQGQTQADLGILGLGMNGHVAFHEPGLHPDFYSGCVKLQDITVKNLELESTTWGKTYGAGAFFRCKALLVIIKGSKKKEILQNTLAGKISARELPAAALLQHPDITILSDFEV